MAKKKPAKREPERASKPKGRTEPVYTVMAFVTLVAMILGCTLLYLDFEEYGKQSAPAEKVPIEDASVEWSERQ